VTRSEVDIGHPRPREGVTMTECHLALRDPDIGRPDGLHSGPQRVKEAPGFVPAAEEVVKSHDCRMSGALA